MVGFRIAQDIALTDRIGRDRTLPLLVGTDADPNGVYLLHPCIVRVGEFCLHLCRDHPAAIVDAARHQAITGFEVVLRLNIDDEFCLLILMPGLGFEADVIANRPLIAGGILIRHTGDLFGHILAGQIFVHRHCADLRLAFDTAYNVGDGILAEFRRTIAQDPCKDLLVGQECLALGIQKTALIHAAVFCRDRLTQGIQFAFHVHPPCVVIIPYSVTEEQLYSREFTTAYFELLH